MTPRLDRLLREIRALETGAQEEMARREEQLRLRAAPPGPQVLQSQANPDSNPRR